jgi:hypothetical protein
MCPYGPTMDPLWTPLQDFNNVRRDHKLAERKLVSMPIDMHTRRTHTCTTRTHGHARMCAQTLLQNEMHYLQPTEDEMQRSSTSVYLSNFSTRAPSPINNVD